MSEIFKHPCIRCKTIYESKDIDPYYCGQCEKVKNHVAAQIDAKFSNRTKKERPLSDLQLYERAQKERGIFINAKMFGI